MAQAKPSRAKRWILPAALLLLFAGLSYSALFAWRGSEISAAMAAKLVCSCRYVMQLDEAACRKELELQRFGWVRVRIDVSRREVSATAMGLRTVVASYEEGAGCTAR
ncbi:MAG: hypothetical protein HY901_24425 [Deltaproteobacteria bacterium]|nr:hypothetical protein [Deltaproteobacteria bacterium]